MTDKDADQAVGVVVLELDGTTRSETWPEREMLSRLQAAVGGDVDCQGLATDLEIWVNDEGLINLPVNPYASAIALACGARQPFYGPAVFTGRPDDDDGRTTSLPDRWGWAVPDLAETLAQMPDVVASLRAIGQQFAEGIRR